MLWFPKKSIPWSGPFRVYTEIPGPSSIIDNNHFQYIFPYHYHAQLLSVNHKWILDIKTRNRALYMTLTRAGTVIFRGACTLSPPQNFTYDVCWQAEGWSTHWFRGPIYYVLNMLSPHVFIIPHDTLDIGLTHDGTADRLADFSITMKQWITS